METVRKICSFISGLKGLLIRMSKGQGYVHLKDGSALQRQGLNELSAVI